MLKTALQIFVAVLLVSPTSIWADDAITTFYIVRHAERADSTEDSDLSDIGIRRAVELRDVLQNVPVSAIYSTDFKRTKKTVDPIAKASRLKPRIYPAQGQTVDALAAEMLDANRGTSVVIVGHSGPPQGPHAVASIVKALSQKPVSGIGSQEFDNLFVVTIREIDSEIERDLHRMWYGPLKSLGRPEVRETNQELLEDQDISAVVRAGDYLVIGADEEDSIQSLQAVDGENAYLVRKTHSLSNAGELDIEGIARQGNTYFVVGSHSQKRKKVDPHGIKTLKRSYAKNRKRLFADEIEAENKRDRIYRFTFDPNTDQQPSEVEPINLNNLLEEHPVLKAFSHLPSKENGIDIEGIATDGTFLYLGFRGPVLRFGFVPVLRVKFDEPSNNHLLFTNLGGRGIRDITKTQDGFLIVAGPIGVSTLSYQLYYWDGRDCIPGKRNGEEPELGKTTLLGTIPTPSGAKAEGIAILDEQPSQFEILVVYDSAEKGGLATFRVARPRP
jgi:hypothetical protein